MHNYDISIDFGDGRIFNFREWKGSERRKIEELRETNQLNKNSILDVFVFGCMETPMYLTDDECLYAIHTLRQKTYDSNTVIPFECSCGHTEFIEGSPDTYYMKASELGEIQVGEKVFYFTSNNIPYEEYEEFRDKNTLEKTYIEMIFNCNSFIIQGERYEEMDFMDKDRFFDQMLPMHEFDELIESYIKSRFVFEPTFEYECPSCNESTQIIVDYIEELLA